MVELIYPPTSVRYDRSFTEENPGELLPIVDSNGIVIAKANRQRCHAKGLLHPVVHLHIIDRLGRICLQRRGADKDTWPDFWDFSAAGHICFGEYAEEALFREAQEEIGLFDFNPVQLGSYIFEGEDERELVFIYATVGTFPLIPGEEEVSEVRYWTDNEIVSALGKGILTPEFEREYPEIKNKLFALL